MLGYEAFLTSDHEIAPITLDPDVESMSHQLRTGLMERIHGPSLPSFSGVWFSGGEAPIVNGLRIMEWRNRPVSNVATLQVNFYQPQGTSEQRGAIVPATVTYAIGPVERGKFALDWLRTTPQAKGLLNEKSGELFPHLKTFWHRVGVMDVEQATLFLQQQLESVNQGTVSFFGIPVEKALVLWLGPAVCMSVLLFLALHVNGFRRGRPSSGGVNRYPWVPLFPDALSVGATWASVVLMPTAANVVLVWRYGHWPEWGAIFGAAFTMAIFALGIWSLLEIRRVRRALV